MDLCIEGNEQTRSINTLDLKNPYFRYTGQPVAPPPGTSGASPSEAYWNQLDAQGARQGISQLISYYFVFCHFTHFYDIFVSAVAFDRFGFYRRLPDNQPPRD